VLSRTAVAGAAAIAAVTALVIALVVPSGHGGTSARHAGRPLQALTAAYVIGRTETALSAAASGDWVVHVHTSYGSKGRTILDFDNGYSLAAQQQDTWYHGPDSNGPLRSQGFTAAGQPVFDSGVVQTPDVYTTTVVDYQARIWWREAQHVTPWTPTPASALTCGDVQNFAVSMDPTYWAADIRKSLACGQFTTSGSEQVDGINAIKLTPVRPGVMAAALWVDPSTYLPMRVAVEMRSPGIHRVFARTMEDVQWLPPTAANLAKLTVPVPPGFAQVPAPPTSH
jgi:hypothetical protein